MDRREFLAAAAAIPVAAAVPAAADPQLSTVTYTRRCAGFIYGVSAHSGECSVVLNGMVVISVNAGTHGSYFEFPHPVCLMEGDTLECRGDVECHVDVMTSLDDILTMPSISA